MNSVSSIVVSSQLEKWYQTFRFTLIKLGLKFGYGEDQVQDFIHQFFLELLEKKIDPATIDNPHAYLSTAFKRKLIDHHRQTNKYKLISIEDDHNNFPEPSVHDMLEHIESNRELIDAIRDAYKKLPKRCRKVIRLKFNDGLMTEEIALRTGLSKRTVYNNLFEGVKLLRASMAGIKPHMQITVLMTCLVLLLPNIASKF